MLTFIKTNTDPNLLETHSKLAVPLYRLGHGCSFQVICDLFGVSIGPALATFNKVLREMILKLFNEYVYMPMSEEEWIAECKGLIENYEFSCVGMWDRFHVHMSTHL